MCFVVAADNAFPLMETLKETIHNKQLIFNYRPSRSHHIVENAFGITALCSEILE
jgi:hypothetical protein